MDFMPPEQQENVFTLLLKSAKQGNGRSLQPSQVQEVIETIQAIQYEMADMMLRQEQLTRFSVVLIEQLGGELTIESDLYVEAELKGLTADWNEEGTEIALATYEVDMPDVPVGDDADHDGEESGLSLVPGEEHTPLTVEGTTPDADTPTQDEEA